jgi:hypothetical protein
MKRKSSRLAEVQFDPALDRPPQSFAVAASVPAFTVRLPEGATVAVPAGFDADEVFTLLLAVREALA